MEAVLFGYVAGSESISSPFVFVIVLLLSASYSSDIQAMFVNILLFTVSGVSVTSHSISIVSLPFPLLTKFPCSYAGKLFSFPSALVKYTVFIVVSYPFVAFVVSATKFPLTILLNLSPVGNWSTIFVALPAFSPSL